MDTDCVLLGESAEVLFKTQNFSVLELLVSQ